MVQYPVSKPEPKKRGDNLMTIILQQNACHDASLELSGVTVLMDITMYFLQKIKIIKLSQKYIRFIP